MSPISPVSTKYLRILIVYLRIQISYLQKKIKIQAQNLQTPETSDTPEINPVILWKVLIENLITAVIIILAKSVIAQSHQIQE
jgi:hypothetical protein